MVLCVTVVIFCLFVGLMSCDIPPYSEHYFQQTLDHFNYYSASGKPATFQQRYLVQDKWWMKNGPIFFYTGNEEDVVSFWNNTGLIFELAPKFHAIVVFCEHRFYGKSLPFGAKKSFEHPYIDFLTVNQALADFAVFIDWFKTNNGAQRSPVIAFGGSYGGMLSAYMRFKYPNLIAGSLSASAPIYLVAGVSSRRYFYEDVSQDFKNALPGCAHRIQQGFTALYDVASKGSQGLRQLSQVFNLCPPLKEEGQVRHLVGWIRDAFATMAMLDYPYPTAFIAVLPGNPVKVACQTILKSSDALSGLAAATAIYYGKESCSDIWRQYLECSDPTGCGIGPAGKAWSYQACTDFIMPDGTYNTTDIFPYLPYTMEQRRLFCQKEWNITSDTNWTRIQLWGKDIKAASNIVFSNGDLDPWHRSGVLEDISDTLVAIVIENAAHHLDLRSPNPADPDSVVKARQMEADWIQKWIQAWR